MEQNKLIGTFIVVLFIGVGIGYVLGKPASVQAPMAHMMPDGSLMGANIDQHFIVQMIPHHDGAIEMARLALEKSKRPEMLSLAQGIIEAQEREITDMKSWYQSWYGSTPPEGGMGHGGMMHMDGMTGDMEVLRAASEADFDRLFIQQMIPHHEMAVMMADMLQAGTARTEMKTLADQIITSQSREIDMMRSWLEAWY